MLKAIELENFKAFGERNRIKFAPITLIFGQNSSGKTSIIQSLNLLKQTVESDDPQAVLLPRGKSVDLGCFQDMIFDHNSEKELGIRLDYDGRLASNVVKQFGVDLRFARTSSEHDVELRSLGLVSPKSSDCIALFEPYTSSEMKKENKGPIKQGVALKCKRITVDRNFWHKDFDFVKNIFGDRNLPDYLRSEENFLFGEHGDPEQVNADQRLDKYIELIGRNENNLRVLLRNYHPFDASEQKAFGRQRILFYSRHVLNSFRRKLMSIHSLGPYRAFPERWYVFSGTTPRNVGGSGESMPELLFRNPALVAETNEWLDKFEVGYRIETNSIGDSSRDLFEVRLVDTHRDNKVFMSLTDVGFGISQILPFIVESLAVSKKIITIEQPEVHVHPRLQAEIGDLLIQGIQSPRSNQFIVETHSEHLILRILRRIRETHEKRLPEGHPGLKSVQLSIVFVARGGLGSRVYHPQIDGSGELIGPWPDGFFDERWKELG